MSLLTHLGDATLILLMMCTFLFNIIFLVDLYSAIFSCAELVADWPMLSTCRQRLH